MEALRRVKKLFLSSFNDFLQILKLKGIFNITVNSLYNFVKYFSVFSRIIGIWNHWHSLIEYYLSMIE